MCEQVISELASQTRKEPRVDVEAWGHPGEAWTLLDVTVCAPWADRYTDKTAVEAAEHRKNLEYPRRGGIAVTGISVDLLGRFGSQLDALLARWADYARARDRDRGQCPRRWQHIWRVKISSAVATGIARQISSAQRSWHAEGRSGEKQVAQHPPAARLTPEQDRDAPSSRPLASHA